MNRRSLLKSIAVACLAPFAIKQKPDDLRIELGPGVAPNKVFIAGILQPGLHDGRNFHPLTPAIDAEDCEVIVTSAPFYSIAGELIYTKHDYKIRIAG
jgi:hypothetical protein